MIGAGISYYGNSLPSYLIGNAKVYDGSFDYDTALAWLQSERTQAFSYNIHAYITSAGIICMEGLLNDAGTSIRGVVIRLLSIGQLQISIANSNLNSIAIRINADFTGYKSIVITYNGNSNASGVECYVDGVAQTKAVITNALSATIISPTTQFIISGRNSGQTKITGKIRQIEKINRVATANEIALASLSGSFQGTGTVSNAEYLLAVDFDKTGTANLTTRASTPTYTITAQGGAAYTQYLP